MPTIANQIVPSVKTILIRGDQPITKMLTVSLTGEGYVAVVESDYKAGLSRAATIKPDIILLDLTDNILVGKIRCEDHPEALKDLRVYIARLRKKIELHSKSHRIFSQKPGIGYKFIGNHDNSV